MATPTYKVQSLGDPAKDVRLMELLEKELKLKKVRYEEDPAPQEREELQKKLDEFVAKSYLLGQEYMKQEPPNIPVARKLYALAESLCTDQSSFVEYFYSEATRFRHLSNTLQSFGALEKQAGQVKQSIVYHQRAIDLELRLKEMKNKVLQASLGGFDKNSSLRIPPSAIAAGANSAGSPLNPDTEGKALLQACKKGDMDTALQIIHRGVAKIDIADSGKNTALHHACQNRMVAVVQSLCEEGVFVNCKNESGNTPLHLCASSSLELTRILLNTGVDIFAQDNSLNTALHYACLANLSDIALVLIERGSDIHSRNKTGNTPLHYAVSSSMSSVVDTLLSRGAQLNCRDNQDNTPLHYACSLVLPSMAMILIHHKPDLNCVNKAQNTALLYACSNSMSDIVMLLIKKGAEVSCKDAQHNTPLHYCCANQMETAVQELLRHKDVDVNATNNQLNTPLHYACSANNLPIVRMLVSKHSNLIARDTNGNTPLHYAMLNEKPEVAEYLISEGASAHIKNADGKSPLDYVMTD